MRRSLVRCSAPVSSVHAPSWVDFITAMVEFRVFGTHRRPHVRHRDLRCRLPTTLPADGNEDRYLMSETATFRTRTTKGFPRWSMTRYAAARPNTGPASHST